MENKKSIRKKASEDYSENLLKSGLVSNVNDLEEVALRPVRLSVTWEEFCLLLFERPEVRTGYSVDVDEINIPVLFVKINGMTKEVESIIKRANSADNIYLLNSFHMFKREAFSTCFDGGTFLTIGDEESQKLILNHENISYLSPLKKRLVMKALKQICEDIRSIKSFNDKTNKDILSAAIVGNERLFKMFHEYDISAEPSKIIINDKTKSPINFQTIVRLLMYHYLFFDVIIISKNGYSSIEGYLPRSCYDEFMV